MTNNKIRWGLLSTARINRRIIPAIKQSKRGILSAVASRSTEKVTSYAAEWDIPLVFDSYQKMLDSGEIDAVYISLPNHLHHEWTIKALEAGVHVLCEKPFALTLDAVDEMINTQEKTGKVLAEAFMYRHHPKIKQVDKLIRSGKIGEVTLVRGTFDFSFSNRENIRLVPEYGGGCMWDVGVYPMSFAQYIMGEPPESVSASMWIGDCGVDETFVGLLEYSGNRFAQISASFRTPWYTFAEVTGTKGRINLKRPFVAVEEEIAITITSEDGSIEKIDADQEPLYLGEIEDMHNSILEATPPFLSLSETRNHIRTTLALYQAAYTHSIVNL